MTQNKVTTATDNFHFASLYQKNKKQPWIQGQTVFLIEKRRRGCVQWESVHSSSLGPPSCNIPEDSQEKWQYKDVVVGLCCKKFFLSFACHSSEKNTSSKETKKCVLRAESALKTFQSLVLCFLEKVSPGTNPPPLLTPVLQIKKD